MPDVFHVLKKDHDEVKAMLAQLEEGPKASTGATPEQLAFRKQAVDAVITEAKKLAPTRPHPHIPPQAGPAKTAGPLAGLADRVRDSVTGRGKPAS